MGVGRAYLFEVNCVLVEEECVLLEKPRSDMLSVTTFDQTVQKNIIHSLLRIILSSLISQSESRRVVADAKTNWE